MEGTGADASMAYDSDTDEDLDMFEAHEDDEVETGPNASSFNEKGSASAAAGAAKSSQEGVSEEFLGGVPCFKVATDSPSPTPPVNTFPAHSAVSTGGPRDRLGMSPAPPPPSVESPPQAPTKKRVRQEWSTEEDTLFLNGLRMHGTNWALIDKMIPTRTRTQIRTHYRYYTRTLEKNTISELYGIGKKIKLRQRGRPRLRLRHRDEEAEKLMPQLVQDILNTVRTLHEEHLKKVVQKEPKRLPPVRRIRPHENMCSKFVLGTNQLIPVAPRLPVAPTVLVPHVPPMVVPGRATVADIKTVDASCSVTTSVFGGLTLSRPGEPTVDEEDVGEIVVKKEPVDEAPEAEAQPRETRRSKRTEEREGPIAEDNEEEDDELRVAE